jgi:hypothetical protein
VKRDAVIAFLGPRLAALYEPRARPAG